MGQIRSVAIACIGFNWHSACCLVLMFGPEEYHGMGLPDFYTKQGIGGLTQLIGSLRMTQTSEITLTSYFPTCSYGPEHLYSGPGRMCHSSP